jgi:hypothetical protein
MSSVCVKVSTRHSLLLIHLSFLEASLILLPFASLPESHPGVTTGTGTYINRSDLTRQS